MVQAIALIFSEMNHNQVTPNTPQINILVPLYNEEEVFEDLHKRLAALLSSSELSISVLMIDDGSTDSTPQLMEQLALRDDRFEAIFLSRNFGHQLALSAGLSLANAHEGILIIDGDLQDPPELLNDFYPYLQNGYDVVYAVRQNRKSSVLKRILYKAFYRLLKKVSYLDIPLDTGDFSLISTRVANHLKEMHEENRFLRGMRSWVGFKQIGIAYDRPARQIGSTKYGYSQLFRLALNGIFNFSEFPIKFISRLGFVTVLLSVFYLIYAVLKLLLTGDVPKGFVSLVFIVSLFGGIQLLSIGVLGEYILRIFFQVKDRPLFIVKKHIQKGKALS